MGTVSRNFNRATSVNHQNSSKKKVNKDNLTGLRTRLADELGIDEHGSNIKGKTKYLLTSVSQQNKLEKLKASKQLKEALKSVIDLVTGEIQKNPSQRYIKNVELLAHFLMGHCRLSDLPEEYMQEKLKQANFDLEGSDANKECARIIKDVLQTHLSYNYFYREDAAKTLDKLVALQTALYKGNEESNALEKKNELNQSLSNQDGSILFHSSGVIPDNSETRPPQTQVASRKACQQLPHRVEDGHIVPVVSAEESSDSQNAAEKTVKDTDSTNSTRLNLEEIPNNERPTTIPQQQFMNQSMPLSSTNHTAKKNTSASFQSTKPESSDEIAPYAASSNNESLSKSTPIPKTWKTATSGNSTKIDKGVLLERLKQQQANKIIELEQFIDELTSKLNAKKLPLTGADFLSLKTEYNKRVSAFGKLPIDKKNNDELKKLSKKQIEIEKLISSKFQQSLDAIDLPLDIKTAFFPTKHIVSYNPITLKIDADVFNKIRKYYILTIAAADSKYPEQQAKYIDYLERLVTLDNLSGTVTINPAYSKGTGKVGFGMSGDTSLTFVTDEVTTGFIFDAPSRLKDADFGLIDTLGNLNLGRDAKLALHANLFSILNLGAGNSRLNDDSVDVEEKLLYLPSLIANCPHALIANRVQEDFYEVHIAGDCNVMVKCGEGEQQKFFGLGAGVIIDKSGKKDWSQIKKFNTTLFGTTSGSTPSESSLVAYIDSEDKINELAGNWDGYQKCEKDLSSPFGSDGANTLFIKKTLVNSLSLITDGKGDNLELLEHLAKLTSQTNGEDEMKFTEKYMQELAPDKSTKPKLRGSKEDDCAKPVIFD